MKKFETKTQYLKYKVLREVAKNAWDDTLLENINEIPKTIVPGKVPTMRCCVYKERAILAERVTMAMGGHKDNPNVIEVIGIACDDCPAGGYVVTDMCRGCLAHRCEDVCKRGAITFDVHQKAHIDKSKCVECGQCAAVCPYTAIHNFRRPCENSCKVKAISMSEDKCAQIDNEKCISCGACLYQCPFGAITDKSYILDVIKMIKESRATGNTKVYAVVAPAISSQFAYAKLGQVVTGINKLGFYQVMEAALGADIVALKETEELRGKGFLTSSCCPAFVSYIEKNFAQLKDKISSNLSPAATVGKLIKERDPSAKVVFIGPCTAKKMEFKREEVRDYIDSVITFAELQALFDSRDIDVTTLDITPLNDASYFGRIFARSGGLTEACQEVVKEENITDFAFKPVVCDGIEECKKALLLASKNVLSGNFIEGMACVGGCVGGAGCLTHGATTKTEVEKYGKQARAQTINESLKKL